MYRFRSGKFAGRTVEHVMLRSAPRLYAMMRWAKAELRNKPHLRLLVEECSRLQVTFQSAQISVRCANQGCRRRARWMTFLTDWTEHYLRLGPKYWCDKHGPPRGEEDDDESQKNPHHLRCSWRLERQAEREGGPPWTVASFWYFQETIADHREVC